MAKTRLVVCCDGTWTGPDEVQAGTPCPTNVARIALAIPEDGADGVAQRVYYRNGTGSATVDGVPGALSGWELSGSVQDAYLFLVEHYEEDAEIFLFGFSRGAYTARTVAGFIRNSGLLRREHVDKLHTAYDLYRDRSSTTHPTAPAATLFRRTFSRDVDITFVGVWDTVGGLGIPVGLPGCAVVYDRWKFHDVKLSTAVRNAFQALAIDEHRAPLVPAIWEQQTNELAERHLRQRLEQVWFAGSHGDVGGGYAHTGLSDVALAWMACRAAECGLTLDFKTSRVPVRPRADGALHDPTGWHHGLGHVLRPMVRERKDDDGEPIVTNEMVIDAAVDRMGGASYAPTNLRSFLDAGGSVDQRILDVWS